MDLSFLTNLKGATQILLGIAIIAISIGVGISLSRYGTVGWNAQRVDDLAKRVDASDKRSLETSTALLNDPAIKKSSPELVKVAEKHIEEIKSQAPTQMSTPYFLDVDNLMSMGYMEVKDEFSRFVKLVYIEDIFLLYPNNPFPSPKTKEEATFAEQFINVNFLEKSFKQNHDLSPLQQYLTPIEENQNKMFDHYKHIKESTQTKGDQQ